jgi:uncharacterized repeat protein (TIGR01451 family)
MSTFSARRYVVLALGLLAFAWLVFAPAPGIGAAPLAQTSPLQSPILSLATFSSPLRAVKPGGKIVYTLVVSNTGPADALNTVVRSTLPLHTRFITTTSDIGTLTFVSPLRPGDAAEWSLGSLAANGAQTRTITFILSVLRQTPTYTRIQFQSTARADNASSVSSVRTHIVGREVASVSPDSGGVLDGGGIIVAFPPGAVSSSVSITYTALTTPTANARTMRIVGRSFILEASDPDGRPVSQFAQPYTLTFNYSDEELAASGLQESQLNLYFYDTARIRWTPIMPCAGCALDTEGNSITVVLDHFTEFAFGTSFQVFLPGLMRSP